MKSLFTREADRQTTKTVEIALNYPTIWSRVISQSTHLTSLSLSIPLPVDSLLREEEVS